MTQPPKTPYSIRDLCLIVVSAVLAGLSAVGYAHDHTLDFGAWFFGLVTILLLFRPLLRRRAEVYAAAEPRNTVPGKERVEFDEREIRRHLSDGRVEAIAWDDIDEIGIVTTDGGPWVDDVFWLFLNKDKSKGCTVSNYADGFKELLPRIQQLPGFDNPAVVEAMGSTAKRSFVVWKRVS